MTKFAVEFASCAGVQQIKNLMREYAKRLHPDLNPGIDDGEFKSMSAAYHAELQNRHLETHTDDIGKAHKYYYNEQNEQEILDKVAELLALNLNGVVIDLVGTWIWVSGETRANRTALKSAKMRYHGKRAMWYWRKAAYKTRYSDKSFSELKSAYGCKTFESKEDAVSV